MSAVSFRFQKNNSVSRRNLHQHPRTRRRRRFIARVDAVETIERVPSIRSSMLAIVAFGRVGALCGDAEVGKRSHRRQWTDPRTAVTNRDSKTDRHHNVCTYTKRLSSKGASAEGTAGDACGARPNDATVNRARPTRNAHARENMFAATQSTVALRATPSRTVRRRNPNASAADDASRRWAETLSDVADGRCRVVARRRRRARRARRLDTGED
jgi:hypothetical protein